MATALGIHGRKNGAVSRCHSSCDWLYKSVPRGSSCKNPLTCHWPELPRGRSVRPFSAVTGVGRMRTLLIALGRAWLITWRWTRWSLVSRGGNGGRCLPAWQAGPGGDEERTAALVTALSRVGGKGKCSRKVIMWHLKYHFILRDTSVIFFPFNGTFSWIWFQKIIPALVYKCGFSPTKSP